MPVYRELTIQVYVRRRGNLYPWYLLERYREESKRTGLCTYTCKRVTFTLGAVSDTEKNKEKHRLVYVRRVTHLVPVSSVAKTRQIHEFG